MTFPAFALTRSEIDLYIKGYVDDDRAEQDNNGEYEDDNCNQINEQQQTQSQQKSRLILILRIKKLTDRIYNLEKSNARLLEQNNKLLNIIQGDMLKIHDNRAFKSLVDAKRFKSIQQPSRAQYDLLYKTYNDLFLKFDETFHRSRGLITILRQIHYNITPIQEIKRYANYKDSIYFQSLSQLFATNTHRLEKELSDWEGKVLVIKEHIKTIKSLANEKIKNIKKSIKQVEKENRDGSSFEILGQQSEDSEKDEIFQCLNPSNYTISPLLTGVQNLKKHFQSFEKRLLFLLNTTTIFQ